MFSKIAVVIFLVMAAPALLKVVGVGVLVCSLVFLLVIVVYWKMRHRIPDSRGSDSQAVRTRKARRAINTGMMDKSAARQTYNVTAKDMKQQKYHDDLFW